MSRKRTGKKKQKRVYVPAATVEETRVDLMNREISWLHFNRRVLREAEDSRTPLLERLKFITVYSTNLDEFFMKRVGGLHRQVVFGVGPRTVGEPSPQEQLLAIRKTVIPMGQDMARCFREDLVPELVRQGIFLLKWADINPPEREEARQYFMKNVFPVLTPLAVDPGHPFPFISNLSTSLGVCLKSPGGEERLFARVKVPRVLSQWIRLEANVERESYRFISLLEVMQHCLEYLFPEMEVLSVMPFRLARNADVERDEEDAEDLLEMVEEEVRQRRFAEVVRLEHGPNPDPWILDFLVNELEVSPEDVYEDSEGLYYQNLNDIADLKIPSLKYPPWIPVTPPAFTDESVNIFNLIRNRDFLLHHPYESFSGTVERFIRESAEDPKVLAIKMTLYRTGDDSPFVRSLVRAAEYGKQVVCLVELKARFDEERNISWAQALENAGVHVVYGVVGLKTHAKTALVVRQEVDGLRCYAHIGTGNYNSSTARLYTDLGLLTSREEVTSEIVELFHYLTGRSLKKDYKKLLVAPVTMCNRFLEMINREAEHQRAGRPAQIIAKFNSLEDGLITTALYEASQAGVSIDLIIRGFCCLRAGVPGLSENIRVISVIGRFLEHSRIFYFRNGQEDPLDGEFFIGSADWMHRNLHARVEAVVPVEERNLKEKCWEILQVTLKDSRQAWEMNADGNYIPRSPLGAEEAEGSHQQLMRMARSGTGRYSES